VSLSASGLTASLGGTIVQMNSNPLGERLVRVSLNGRLDTQGVDEVETRFIAATVSSGNNAIVDLSEVEFVSSMGIRLLVSTARSLKSREATLALYAAPAQIRQVFEAVSLHKIIPICATEAEALALVTEKA
jgi:anti-anti-sigma factor